MERNVFNFLLFKHDLWMLQVEVIDKGKYAIKHHCPVIPTSLLSKSSPLSGCLHYQLNDP